MLLSMFPAGAQVLAADLAAVDDKNLSKRQKLDAYRWVAGCAWRLALPLTHLQLTQNKRLLPQTPLAPSPLRMLCTRGGWHGLARLLPWSRCAPCVRTRAQVESTRSHRLQHTATFAGPPSQVCP